MHALYNYVSGPLVWVAFAVFIGGSIWRLWSLTALARKKDVYIFAYFSWHYALRSIMHWMIPFMNKNSRDNPVLTVVTFSFHLCLVLAPLFVMGHVAMLDKAFGLTWPTLPDSVGDVTAFIVLAGCVYFLVRRLSVPEVQYVTSFSDWFILALAAAPFITGVLAYHQVFDPEVTLILHILAGEAMLIAIPFTRLSHMLFAPLTRAYIGSEFGAVRHARDW